MILTKLPKYFFLIFLLSFNLSFAGGFFVGGGYESIKNFKFTTQEFNAQPIIDHPAIGPIREVKLDAKSGFAQIGYNFNIGFIFFSPIFTVNFGKHQEAVLDNWYNNNSFTRTYHVGSVASRGALQINLGFNFPTGVSIYGIAGYRLYKVYSKDFTSVHPHNHQEVSKSITVPFIGFGGEAPLILNRLALFAEYATDLGSEDTYMMSTGYCCGNRIDTKAFNSQSSIKVGGRIYF